MISSQTRHSITGFDEIVQEGDADFIQSGLKVPSVIRIGRLAVVEGEILLGAVGQIVPKRLGLIKEHLSSWLMQQ